MPSKDSSPNDPCKECGCARGDHMGRPQGCLLHGFHAFVPADAETAGEPEAPHEHDWSEWGAVYHGGPYQWRRCACGEKEFRPDEFLAAAEQSGVDLNLAKTPEPEAPRRPANAVAYVLRDGSHFEIALPGDATVCALEGALVITHSQSPIKGLVQVKPWGDQ